MLKLFGYLTPVLHSRQPPSGGCVLKHLERMCLILKLKPAAFRRLCVETIMCCFSI